MLNNFFLTFFLSKLRLNSSLKSVFNFLIIVFKQNVIILLKLYFLKNYYMKKILLFFTVLLVAFSAMAQEKVPNVTIKTLTGDEVNSQELAEDKLVVISLWATWCVPCLKELDAISYVYEDWQDETGVELIAISVDDARTVKRVRPLISGKAWDYNILLDTNNDLKRALGASSVPLTLLVKNNKIVYRHSGYSPGAEDELYEKIKEYAN